MSNAQIVFALVFLFTGFVVAFVLSLRDNRRAKKIEKMNGQLEAMLDRKVKLAEEIKSCEERIAAMTGDLLKAEGVKKMLAEHPKLEAEFKTLLEGVTARRQEYEDLARKISDKQKELDSLLLEWDKKLDAKRKEYEQALVDWDKKLDAKRKAYEQAVVDWDKRIEAKRKEYDAAISEFDKKIATKKKELDDVETKLRAEMAKVSKLDDIDNQIKAKQELLVKLTGEVAEAQKRIGEVMTQIAKGLERLEKMNLSGVQILRREAFEPIKEPVFSIGADHRRLAAFESEGAALERVREHFGVTGFDIPDRLLAAFHTSLKTSEMSSLTVMAGVSGTGKSALPKLYSEAMGIFFQPLAVEPRWDSPKDLLGFFNYATNRYEPTALARALFQFQGIRPTDGFLKNWNGDMSEYVLMPLLDEMNLARVEYYFSEFLSKLELRRVIAPITRENLASVAMEVFQGWKGVDQTGRPASEEAIRLYADKNTLFVGTMNEDETTQSLSDKVIDRANVLYFGRPNQLKAAAATGRDRGIAPGLKAATWASWVQTVEPGRFQDAEAKLASLNRVLADLNRPFAHRTFQAMLAYVANYFAPELDEADRINRALADQIGMRIMPKLRGIDLAQNAEVLGRVGSIVAEVGDEPLSQTFRNASDIESNKSGFFQWTGFDWH